jgi:hypothetical protein
MITLVHKGARVRRFTVALFIAIILISGCKTSPDEYLLPAPRVLTLTAAGSDSLSILLTWDEVEEAYRYIVGFNGTARDTVQGTTWMDPSPENLGVYHVWSYRDGRTSELSADAADTIVYAENRGPIYGSSVSDSTNPSGFVWTSDGEGRVYPLSRPDSVDIYFETQNPPHSEDLADISEFSPAHAHTYMAYSANWDFEDLLVVPDVDYFRRLPARVGGSYLLNVRGRYAKIEITEYDTIDLALTLRYAIQTVEGFRRLGSEGENSRPAKRSDSP